MRFDQEIPMTQDGSARSSRWAFPFLVFAIAAGCFMYRILVLKRLEQSALLFVGIPALLAVIIACTPKAKTLIGGTLKVTTLFLLLSALCWEKVSSAF